MNKIIDSSIKGRFSFYGCSFISWSLYECYIKLTNTSKTRFNFSSLAPLPASCYNFYVYFKLVFVNIFIEMLRLTCNEKVTCEGCGTQNEKRKIVWHKKRYSTGSLHCSEKPFCFSITFHADLSFYFAKRRSSTKAKHDQKRHQSGKEFPNVFSVQ